MKKKYYIQTFGCQMNVHDSEQMAALLTEAGYDCTENAATADFIILNTCSIREKAAQKVYSQLGRFRDLKRANPRLIIGVGGCLAQQWGGKFFKKAPYLDLIFGAGNFHRLPEMIKAVEATGSQVVETELHESVNPVSTVPALPQKGQVSAYVTIMQGCNNFCAYCVVPYLRGRERSRKPGEIITEIRRLAACGIKEVTLLGQNVNSYGNGLNSEADFAQLLWEIGNVKGIERIRFTTSHPKDLSTEVINCFVEVAALCEHIHLPVQSGSDQVLRRMNRGYTRAEYREKVAALREVCPDISITSDIIVGFPGETEENFQETIDLMEIIRFDNLFSFKYSERAGTAAAGFEGKVSERIKDERLQFLQSLQESYTLARSKQMEGLTLDVLVEGRSKNSFAEVTGRTRTNKIVNFPGSNELLGKTVPVVIMYAFQHSLRGELRSKKEMDRC